MGAKGAVESVLTVRVIVDDSGKVFERDMQVRSMFEPEPEAVKSLADLIVKDMINDVKGWRRGPESKGQSRIPGTEDL